MTKTKEHAALLLEGISGVVIEYEESAEICPCVVSIRSDVEQVIKKEHLDLNDEETIRQVEFALQKIKEALQTQTLIREKINKSLIDELKDPLTIINVSLLTMVMGTFLTWLAHSNVPKNDAIYFIAPFTVSVSGIMTRKVLEKYRSEVYRFIEFIKANVPANHPTISYLPDLLKSFV